MVDSICTSRYVHICNGKLQPVQRSTDKDWVPYSRKLLQNLFQGTNDGEGCLLLTECATYLQVEILFKGNQALILVNQRSTSTDQTTLKDTFGMGI